MASADSSSVEEVIDQSSSESAFFILNSIFIGLLILVFAISMYTRVLFFSRPMIYILFFAYYGN